MAVTVPPRKVAFLIFSDTHILDLAGPAQVFYEANQLGKLGLEIQYASLRPERNTRQGIRLSDLRNTDELQLGIRDLLIIPGVDFRSFQNGELESEIANLTDWVQRLHQSGISLASICTGSLILAEMGLLDGANCTSHWKSITYMRRHYPEVHVHSDRLFVKDRRIYSSAGMTSGMDLCLAILEKYYGPVLTSKVARELVLFMRRDETHSQESVYLDYQTHFNPAIHRVQDYIISHPAENPTLDRLSDIANMSSRTLTRRFREVTNHTITEFKHEVKAEHAKALLNNPDFTLEEIAEKCGYRNARQLRRIWKEKIGGSPADYRNRT